jgi:hypothetical protein
VQLVWSGGDLSGDTTPNLQFSALGSGVVLTVALVMRLSGAGLVWWGLDLVMVT